METQAIVIKDVKTIASAPMSPGSLFDVFSVFPESIRDQMRRGPVAFNMGATDSAVVTVG